MIFRVFKNFSWIVFEKIVRILLNTIITSIIAKQFGPSAIGLINLAQSALTVGASFGNLGLEKILIRDFSQRVKFSHSAFTHFFRLLTFGGILGFIVTVLIGLFSGERTSDYLMFILFGSTLLFQGFELYDYFNQSALLSHRTSFARVLSCILCFIGKCILLSEGYGILGVALMVLLETMISALLLFYFSKRKSLSDELCSPPAAYFSILKESLPLMTAGVFVSLYMRIDQFIIVHFLGIHELGFYTSAIFLTESWNLLLIAFVSSLFPLTTRSLQSESSESRHLMLWLYQAIAALSYVCMIINILISPFAIRFLFGSSFTPTIFLCQILSLSIPFVFVGTIRSIFITSFKLTKYSLYSAVYTCIAKLLLTIVALSFFQLAGAAYAAIFSYAFAVILTSLMIQPLRGQVLPILTALLFPNPLPLLAWLKNQNQNESHP